MSEKINIENLLKKASKVRGSIDNFQRFINKEIIAVGLGDLLKDKEFVDKLLAANPNFILVLDDKQLSTTKHFEEYFRGNSGELIISQEEIDKIPDDKEERYEYAKKMEEEGKYELAKRIYLSISEEGKGRDMIDRFVERYKDTGDVAVEDKSRSTYYKARYAYLTAKAKNGEKFTEEEIEELESLLDRDKKDISKLVTDGKGVEFDVFKACFEDMDTMMFLSEFLPQIKPRNKSNKKTKKKVVDEEIESEEETNIKPKKPKSDIKRTLTPSRRAQIFTKELGEEPRMGLGKGTLAGFVLFVYEKSNVAIFEKFYDVEDGKMFEAEPNFTYLIHRNARLNLEAISKGELDEARRDQFDVDKEKRLVRAINHREAGVKKPVEAYKRRVAKAIEKMEQIHVKEGTPEFPTEGDLKTTKVEKDKPKKEEKRTAEEAEIEQPIEDEKQTEERTELDGITVSTEEAEIEQPIEDEKQTEERTELDGITLAPEDFEDVPTIEETVLEEENPQEVSENSSVREKLHEIGEVDIELGSIAREIDAIEEKRKEELKEKDNIKRQISDIIREGLADPENAEKAERLVDILEAIDKNILKIDAKLKLLREKKRTLEEKRENLVQDVQELL